MMTIAKIADEFERFRDEERATLPTADTAEFDAKYAALVAKLRSLEPSKKNRVSARRAFKEYGFEFDDDKIQRICRRHEGEWAVNLGTWHVVEPDFGRHVALVDCGRASF
jgi:hypothetical protein